ncbi:MAG TPA: hypothetical protein VHA70_15520 [Bauldia sp.]|nr:hypothetical protein [Bauldia sp.]
MARQSFESSAFDGEEEKPIDPAFLRVQARLRRLMLIGGGTLFIGIAAVFGAILYKIATYDSTGKPLAAGAAVPTVSVSALGLPAGARLVSTALDGNRLALTYEAGGTTVVVVLDVASGAVARRMNVQP